MTGWWDRQITPQELAKLIAEAIERNGSLIYANGGQDSLTVEGSDLTDLSLEVDGLDLEAVAEDLLVALQGGKVIDVDPAAYPTLASRRNLRFTIHSHNDEKSAPTPEG